MRLSESQKTSSLVAPWASYGFKRVRRIEFRVQYGVLLEGRGQLHVLDGDGPMNQVRSMCYIVFGLCRQLEVSIQVLPSPTRARLPVLCDSIIEVL
jgi:hypothetical protein